MRDASAAVKTYLATATKVWFADLYSLTLLNGTVHRWTSCDVPITIGGNTYLSNGAILKRSSVRFTSLGEVDNLNVELAALVVISSKAIGLHALQGTFVGGRLQLDRVVGAFPGDLSIGRVMAWFEGRIAATNLSDNVVRMTVESDLAALDRLQLPRFVYRPGCPHATYDANCQAVKATFTVAGSASGTLTTTSMQSTTAGIVAKATGYYDLGVVVFTSGALNGLRRSVRTHTLSGGTATFLFALPFSVAPSNGDTFNAIAGDDRKLATCNTKFSNLVNFRGFPHVPATEGGT